MPIYSLTLLKHDHEYEVMDALPTEDMHTIADSVKAHLEEQFGKRITFQGEIGANVESDNNSVTIMFEVPDGN